MNVTTSPNMDAQQIVLDTDPEAASTDMGLHKNDNKSCCCLCRLIKWYLYPITCGIGHSILCIIYHHINFALALAFIIFDSVAIGTSFGLIALFCVGIPLLWISFEIVLILARIDLGIVRVMVEQKSKIDPSREHLLHLSLYFGDFPLCCCWNRDDSNCLNIMFNRLKYLFTSCDLYTYICYQVFIKPWSMFAWGWTVVVGVNIGLLGLPIWYLVNDSMFKENKITIGWNPNCEYPDEGGVICDTDYFWIINTFGRALYVAIVALLLLPLTLRLNNYFAYLCKVCSYKFYTYYYTGDQLIINDKKLLLQKQRIDSV